jgi:hypothetical protein
MGTYNTSLFDAVQRQLSLHSPPTKLLSDIISFHVINVAMGTARSFSLGGGYSHFSKWEKAENSYTNLHLSHLRLFLVTILQHSGQKNKYFKNTSNFYY